jgi:hypothetical protein
MNMRGTLVRYGALLIVLTLPLGGCLEVVGTKFNRDPSVDPASFCRHKVYSYGETVGYGCPPPRQAQL